MLKKIKYLIAATSLMLVPVIATSYVSAATAKDSVCQGLGLTSDTNNNCTGDSSSPGVNDLIHTVISIMSYFVGVLSVIMIIVAAVKYVTAGGESSKVTSAKQTLTYALIGVVIAALAQVLVRYVITTANTTTPPSSVTPASNGGPKLN